MNQHLLFGPVNAVKIDTPPIIDGSVDDACWNRAAKIDRFVDIYKATPEAVTEQTSARVAYDDENLYIAVSCRESRMNKIRADCTQYDPNVYNDDCVEVFLQPINRGGGDYFHFVVNSLGATAESMFRSNMMDSAWSPDWQAAAKRGTDSWTVEIAIPFACLEITPKTGPTWGFNICRNQVSKGELSAVFPTFAFFHVPAKFGDLTGLDVDFSMLCYSLQDLSFGKGKVGSNVTGFTLINNTGRASDLVAHLRLVSRSKKAAMFTRKLTLTPGQRKPVEIPYRLVDNGRHEVRLFLADAKTGKAVCAASRNMIIPPPPILLKVTEPNYDNSIYATQEIDEICADVDLNVDQSLLESGCIRYEFTDGEKTLEQNTLGLGGKDILSINIDAKGLKTGSYRLQTALLDKHGCMIARDEQEIRKPPSFPGEVRFDDDNNMLVDGKPFFPIGIFQVNGSQKYYPEIREAGMNIVQMYSDVGETTEEDLKTQLDALHENGLKLMLHMPMEVVFNWTGEKRDEFLKRRVDLFGKHPALAVWYTADEPDIATQYTSPETLKDVRDLIKRLDPYHPVSICILFAGRYAEYINSCDILMGDPYPGWDAEGSRASMEKISSSVDAGFAATKNKKPYWVIPGIIVESQYFPQNAPERGPNYREIRCETYMAITHGVKGIIYYNLGSYPTDWVPEHLGTWHGLKAVTKELSELTSVLLANRSDKPVSITGEDKSIHFILKEVDGSYYLMAVNSGKESKNVEFSLPWLKAKSLKVVSEDRTVPVEGGKLTDEFGKYEVHIYTTAPDVPNLPTTKQIEAKCQQLDREFEESRQSNLAAAKDVVVEASSARRRAISAVDGIFGSAWVDATPGVYPDWWQIDFKALKSIGRIVIDSNLVDYEIQCWDDGDWKTVEKVEGNKETKRVHTYASPISTSRIRLYITKAGGPELYLNEIEFYKE